MKFSPVFLMILAQLHTPDAPPSGIGSWLMCLLYIVGIFFFLVKGATEAKAFFGRKPPIDRVIEQVNLDIKGLVTKATLDERFEEERRRDVGLEKQISDVRHKLPSLEQARQTGDDVLRQELKEALDRLSGEMKAGFATVEEKRAINIGVLHRDLKEAEKRIAAIQADTESHTRALGVQDGKIDRILERLPRRTS